MGDGVGVGVLVGIGVGVFVGAGVGVGVLVGIEVGVFVGAGVGVEGMIIFETEHAKVVSSVAPRIKLQITNTFLLFMTFSFLRQETGFHIRPVSLLAPHPLSGLCLKSDHVLDGWFVAS